MGRELAIVATTDTKGMMSAEVGIRNKDRGNGARKAEHWEAGGVRAEALGLEGAMFLSQIGYVLLSSIDRDARLTK